MRKFIILSISILLLCSCNRERQFNSFVYSDSIRLQVGSSVQFDYNSNTCQLAFNRNRKSFRAQSDNSSDYFAVVFSNIPSSIGESVSANITWTTKNDVVTRNNLSLEVVRIEREKIWLWSESARIGLSLVILE